MFFPFLGVVLATLVALVRRRYHGSRFALLAQEFVFDMMMMMMVQFALLLALLDQGFVC